jgi:hypothetical protein
MRHLVAAFGMLALLSAGSVNAGEIEGPRPVDRLLASIRITESSHHGPVKHNQGFFFYVRPGEHALGYTLEGYEVDKGKVVDAFGGASESREVIAAIEAVGLRPFDFEAESTRILDQLAREAAGQDRIFVHGARDGAEWEIVIVTGAGRFQMKAWNPRGTIDLCAPRSENIARLKKVLDLLAAYYGELKVGPG